METVIMNIKDIHPAAYNPRVTLKPGDAEWEALQNSLSRFGLVEPLIVNKTTGLLVSGHQRLNVLKTQGAETAEVVIIELDAEKEKLLNIAMNKIDGDWDYEKLKELFDGFDEEDIKFTGFSEDELENLFDSDYSSLDEWADSTDDTAETKEDKEQKQEEPEKPEKEFSIFLSFPTKELAEKWLKDKGIDAEYVGTGRNITIRMEGLAYGTGN